MRRSTRYGRLFPKGLKKGRPGGDCPTLAPCLPIVYVFQASPMGGGVVGAVRRN